MINYGQVIAFSWSPFLYITPDSSHLQHLKPVKFLDHKKGLELGALVQEQTHDISVCHMLGILKLKATNSILITGQKMLCHSLKNSPIAFQTASSLYTYVTCTHTHTMETES